MSVYNLKPEEWAAKLMPALRRAVNVAIDEGFPEVQIKEDIVDLLNSEATEVNKTVPAKFRQAHMLEYAAVHPRVAELAVEAVKAERSRG